MDPREAYILMSKRYNDTKNNNVIVPKKLQKFIESLEKKNKKYHYQYENLDEFYYLILKIFLIEYSRDSFTLKIKNNISIDFNISQEKINNFYYVDFNVKQDNSNINCIKFEWYPFLKYIHISSIFYNTKDKNKLEVNNDCKVSNIPDKAGEFFLNLIEDLTNKLGVTKIFLTDGSSIVFNNKKISLALFYLQKNNMTYYGKFGYKPIHLKEEYGDILNDIAYKIDFSSGENDLNYVKDRLKKIKPLTKSNINSWIKSTSKLKHYLPNMYLKKLN